MLLLLDRDFENQSPVAESHLIDFCKKLKSQTQAQHDTRYVRDLQSSCDSFAHSERSLSILAKSGPELFKILEAYTADCRAYVNALDVALRSVVKETKDAQVLIRHSPRICPQFWLQQLNQDNIDKLSKDWKRVVVNYGLALNELQRSQQLLMHVLLNQDRKLIFELDNVKHTN
jgi:hypothetical protein